MSLTESVIDEIQSDEPAVVSTILESDLENAHEGVKTIHDLTFDADVEESPIDIHLPNTTKLKLPPMEWHHIDLPPKKVKCTNTGHTLIYSAKWLQERPYLSGGPFLGNYVFSQLHFHWGANDMEGSEHSFSGSKLPLEMHAVFFKSSYLNQETALRKKDGMCVVAYLFQLQDEINSGIKILNDATYAIRRAHSSARLANDPLTKFIKPFQDDYFLYLGTVKTSAHAHYILWIIAREPLGICHEQIETFRSLLDKNDMPLIRNFREVFPLHDRPVYHINPSANTNATLLLPQKCADIKLSERPQQTSKYPRLSTEYTSPAIFTAQTTGSENPPTTLRRPYSPKIPIRINYSKCNHKTESTPSISRKQDINKMESSPGESKQKNISDKLST